MTAAIVDDAIRSRMSARAFLPKAVAREDIEAILDVASRAPSGTNCQPWKVYVLQGASRNALVDKTCAAHDAIHANPELAAQYQEEYDYYPAQWVSPYIDRRRENGWGLYGLLGIGKADKDKMHAQHQRNFRFFDAPVGLMFTIDKVMGRGSLVDYGAFRKTSWWPRGAVVSTPARRQRGTASPASSFLTSGQARARCWSAACRWAMPTRMRRSTPSTLPAFR